MTQPVMIEGDALYLTKPVVEWLHVIFENQGVIIIEQCENVPPQTKGGGFYFDKETTESAWKETPWGGMVRDGSTEMAASRRKRNSHSGSGHGAGAGGGQQIVCPGDVPDKGASDAERNKKLILTMIVTLL